MLHMGKHGSYDEPPYFGVSAKKLTAKKSLAAEQTRTGPSSLASEEEPGSFMVHVSPGKRIQYSSQCMEQLSKWHSL